VKAISLWQPWATLIALGVKPFETRHWPPPRGLIGRTIAIHAAKKIVREAATELIPFNHQRRALPTGCLICTATLDAAFRLGELGSTDGFAPGTKVPAMQIAHRMTSRPLPESFMVRIDEFGDYSPDRWAWLLTNVHRLDPVIPTIGRQGFFDVALGDT